VPIEHAWEYDPDADSWKAIAPLPTKLGAAAATVVNGKIFVVGGGGHPERATGRTPSAWDPHCSSGLVYQYDPATDRYEQRASMLIPRNHHRMEEVNGRIYVIGGRIGSSTTRFANMIDLVEEYDPATDTWDPAKARMRNARSSMTSGVRDGLIYVAGGAGAPAVEAYDPAADKWTQVAQMRVARQGAGGAIIGNRFHIVSGHVRTSTGSEAVADHDALQLE
jgi:N-acetylneuraminic acid mutarotase